MTTISIANQGRKTTPTNTKNNGVIQKIKDKYFNYLDRQEGLEVLWFLRTVIIIPCVYMVISILAMSTLITNYEYYIGFTVLLFYANIVAHIAQVKSRYYVALFHLSSLLFILTPIITYLIITY